MTGAAVVFMAIVLATGLMFARLAPRPSAASVSSEESGQTFAATAVAQVAPEREGREQPFSKPVATEASSAAGMSQQRCFRFILENGQCRLDAMEEVTGDFRRRRGQQELSAGMIACELLGANGSVLAEELVNAPDRVCAVLDPNLEGGDESVALLTDSGPKVFQVRFPKALSGEKVELFRITQTQPKVERTLLLTLSLPQ
jgi:hypothetical protein